MLYDAITRRVDFAPDLLWTALYIAWIVGSTVFLLLRRRRPSTTLAWLLAFWTMPILSAIGYWLLGPHRLDEQNGLRQTARRVAASVIPAPADELPPEFSEQVCFASLARVSRSSGDVEPEPRRCRSLSLYRNGAEAYPAIAAAIEAAQCTVHLEYYIWEPDSTGTHFRDQLVRRARDGIEVRLIVDAIGAKNCRGDFWIPLLKAGGEVLTFNPPHPLKPQPGKINFRSHRKLVIVDGDVAFTGGINISDVESGIGGAPWRDTHLRLAGPPAADLQAIFLEDWLYGLPVLASGRRATGSGKLAGVGESPPLPPAVERWFKTEPEACGPWVQIIDSGPDEPTLDIHLLLFTAITCARHRIWITTPYLVPDEAILTALESAAARGVDVRILVPAKGDSPLVQAAANTYARDIASRGAQVWHYLPVMNHAKTLVIDDSFAVVGTANLDNRSFRLNFELVVAIFDKQIAGELADLFEQDLADSRRFDPDQEKLALADRLLMNAARLLSPLL